MTQPTTRVRQRLAVRQARLLNALVVAGPVPEGFDSHRLAVQAKALRAKRRRIVAALVPDLVEDLGGEFDRLFDDYASGHPRRSGASYRADAERFATWLVKIRATRPPARQPELAPQ